MYINNGNIFINFFIIIVIIIIIIIVFIYILIYSLKFKSSADWYNLFHKMYTTGNLLIIV